MDPIGVLALVVVVLAPGVRKVLDSVAYRNRARGQAEIIRARRGNALVERRR